MLQILQKDKSFNFELQKNRFSKKARQEAKGIAAAAPSQQDSLINNVVGDQVKLQEMTQKV